MRLFQFKIGRLNNNAILYTKVEIRDEIGTIDDRRSFMSDERISKFTKPTMKQKVKGRYRGYFQ